MSNRFAWGPGDIVIHHPRKLTGERIVVATHNKGKLAEFA